MDRQVGFRLPPELIERIDGYAAHRAQELGTDVTRTDATRMLLTAALNAFDAEQHGQSKKRK